MWEQGRVGELLYERSDDPSWRALFRRQGNEECAAFPQLRLHPDFALVPVKDLLGDGQAQSFTIARGGIQAVEDLKRFGLVFRRDADAIVLDVILGSTLL